MTTLQEFSSAGIPSETQPVFFNEVYCLGQSLLFTLHSLFDPDLRSLPLHRKCNNKNVENLRQLTLRVGPLQREMELPQVTGECFYLILPQMLRGPEAFLTLAAVSSQV